MEYQVGIIKSPWKDILLEEKAQSAPLNKAPPASLHSWSDTKRGTTALGFPMRDTNDSPIDKFLVCIICPGGMLGKWGAADVTQ